MKTKELFNEIATNYDLVNKIISLGLDRGWRKRAVEILEPESGKLYLDLGAGTGDIAIEFGRTATKAGIVSLDPALHMLNICKEKLLHTTDTHTADPENRYPVVCGNGLALPFRNETFDGAISAFCIRNIDDRNAVARELARVMKPQGKLVILDLWKPSSSVMSGICTLYNKTMLPVAGTLFSKGDAYRYLARSIQNFPPAEEIGTIFENYFENVKIYRLSGGIVSILSLVKNRNTARTNLNRNTL